MKRREKRDGHKTREQRRIKSKHKQMNVTPTHGRNLHSALTVLLSCSQRGIQFHTQLSNMTIH